ncbi:MAG: hypothetical protein ABIP94_01450, partial [Planctomycetota bacterium]
ISDEDTLLAEDDEEDSKPRRGSTARASRSAPVVVAAAASSDPGWVTAVGILGCLVMIWGCFIIYNVSQESDTKDSMFTSAWAEKAK